MPIKILPFTQKVSDDFLETMIAQDEKGIEKYNQALDPMDSKYDWLNMATEELADCLKYFKAEQVRRDSVLKDVFESLDVLADLLKEQKDASYYITTGIKLKLEQLTKNL